MRRANPNAFEQAQRKLGLNRAQMAKAIGMSARSVDEMRAGRRPVTRRTEIILEALLAAQAVPATPAV